MATQEQDLNTGSIEVYHTRQDPRWRLYKDTPETVQHITAGRKMLEGKADMEHHNQVADIRHRNIKNSGSRWETPPKVTENKQVKVLWDFQIQTNKLVLVNQPDMVVDEHQRTAVVVDVEILSDSNIRKNKHETREK